MNLLYHIFSQLVNKIACRILSMEIIALHPAKPHASKFVAAWILRQVLALVQARSAALFLWSRLIRHSVSWLDNLCRHNPNPHRQKCPKYSPSSYTATVHKTQHNLFAVRQYGTEKYHSDFWLPHWNYFPRQIWTYKLLYNSRHFPTHYKRQCTTHRLVEGSEPLRCQTQLDIQIVFPESFAGKPSLPAPLRRQ